MLLSKARFRYLKESSERRTLGPVWRVRYPSRFGRDVLCCDIFVSSSPATPAARIRLINVHLDSLPIHPSLRPQQISIIAALLRSSGRDIAAGDFNSVFPEDETLVRDNGLVDAWVELHPREPGFTWGIDCTQPFPPNRLDKVAIVGLKVQDIEIKHPDYISVTGTTGGRLCGVSTPIEALQIHEREHSTDELVPWSDHSGLRGSFRLDGLYY